MRRAVCPGSFDPVTNGHLDIVERAASLFDEVVVAVGVNQSKTPPLHRRRADRDARPRRRATSPTCRSTASTACSPTFCAERGIQAIVKGLRAVSDFDYELQMAQMNSSLTDVETVFVPTSPEWSFLASSPGQGGRDVRRRRLGAGARLRPRARWSRAAAERAPTPERVSRRAAFCRCRHARWIR